MSKTLTPVATNTNTWGDLIDLVNEVANAFGTTVGSAANSTGESTSGNVQVTGVLAGNVVSANTLRGGTVGAAANLTITSNLVATGNNVNVTSNSTFTASFFTVKSNSSISAITVTGNSTTTDSSIGGNNITVTSNAAFTGKALAIPTGNTGNRPGTTSNGMIRFNTETGLLEMYTSTGWKNFISYSNAFSATDVAFTPANNISAVTVQLAIEEVDSEKVAKAGDSMSGTLSISKNPTTLPSSPAGSLIIMGQNNSVNSTLDSISFAAPSKFLGRRAGGNNASKSALSADDVIVRLGGRGYDGSSYSSAERGYIDVRASQAWNTSAHGTKVTISTTANGTTTGVDTLIVSANGTTVNSALTVNGTVTGINSSMVGLGNVDNTSDADKPVSTATQTELDDKVSLSDKDQAITGGARYTSEDLGTVSTGTQTLDPGDGPMQHLNANGAFTLAPGTNVGMFTLDITFGSGAGTITTTGWTKVVGYFSNTSGYKYRCSCSIGNAGSLLTIQPMQ